MDGFNISGEQFIGYTRIKNTFSAVAQLIACIEMYGSQLSEIFQRDVIYTMLMEMHQIIHLLTYNAYPSMSIGLYPNQTIKELVIHVEGLQAHGMDHQKELSGIKLKQPCVNHGKSGKENPSY